jgi:hypothetical protein
MHEYRQHRHVRTRFDEMADAFLERLQRLWLAARAFREDHRGLAAV